MRIQKTVSPTISFGKYKATDFIVPLLLLVLAVFIKWENYISGDLGIGFRVFLLFLALYYWKIVKFLQNKTVRGFKTHVLYRLGFKNGNYFPKNNEREFLG